MFHFFCLPLFCSRFQFGLAIGRNLKTCDTALCIEFIVCTLKAIHQGESKHRFHKLDNQNGNTTISKCKRATYIHWTLLEHHRAKPKSKLKLHEPSGNRERERERRQSRERVFRICGTFESTLAIEREWIQKESQPGCVNTRSLCLVVVVLVNQRSQCNLYRGSLWKNMIQPLRIATENRSKWTDNNACWKFSTQPER